MTEFKKKMKGLLAARKNHEKARLQLFSANEDLKRIEAEKAVLKRSFDKGNSAHKVRMEKLDTKEREAGKALEALVKAYNKAKKSADKKFVDFSNFTDPRPPAPASTGSKTGVSMFSVNYPFLLFPLRMETRFKTLKEGGREKRKLWIRAYPDDCVVDSFESIPSELEVKNARKYWIEMLRAGGVESEQRGAWKALVGSHGSGRAEWIIENESCRPLNAGGEKRGEGEIILVISTEVALVGDEKTALDVFWKKVWRANGDKELEAEYFSVLERAVGAARAQEISGAYRPVNMDEDPPTLRTRANAIVRVETLVFKKTEDIEMKRDSWTQAAKVNVMPDRLVFIGYVGNEKIFEELGKPIPSPLVVGPNPSASENDQIRQDDGDIIVSNEMKWLFDFDRAIECGMGVEVDLDKYGIKSGIDRLLVLGINLGLDEKAGKEALETLIKNHKNSNKGFAIVPQGTPTNNTEEGGAGFSYTDDSDESFDRIFNKATLPPNSGGWHDRADGHWLADCLGIEVDTLNNVSHSEGRELSEARAMNTALWPATLGYFMETMMSPVFNDITIQQTRWFYNNFVSCRSMLPVVRIGSEPYGILCTTPFSRMDWVKGKKIRRVGGLSHPEGFEKFLAGLYDLLKIASADWSSHVKDLSHVGDKKEAHQTLLDIVGLSPGSVEFYQRYAESMEQLNQRLNLEGKGYAMESASLSYWHRSEKLLKKLGYKPTPGEGQADILGKFFLRENNLLNVPLVDDRPLSETDGIREYAHDGSDSMNYIEWLHKAAKTSLDTVRLEKGFNERRVPTSMLYKMLRHAIMLGYWESGIRLYENSELLSGEDLNSARSEPSFIHIKENARRSESRWHYLYRPERGITGDDKMLVTDYVSNLLHEGSSSAGYLRNQLDALEVLQGLPTARLERLLTEHIDSCTYRLDAWKSSLIEYRLASMRYQSRGKEEKDVNRGIYLGAYGWLEEVRPEGKKNSPVEANSIIEKMESGKGGEPVKKDSTNSGFIMAPSLNHAVTAAILRNGFISNATRDNPETLSVNLSSERVRRALSIIEGIRNGQSLAALLGYRLERGLHDDHGIGEVDEFIFKLRKTFPLYSGRLTQSDADRPIQAVEARNVLNGLDLIEHINKSNKREYPFGKDLPDASEAQAGAINTEVEKLLDLHDAVADLAIAESVHQVAMGNYDRASATLDAYSKGTFPPLPDVVKTPRSGITLTHHVGLHFEPGPAPGRWPEVTPRAIAEPAVNKWLSRVMPPPESVACVVSNYHEPVTQKDLGLQPIDLLYILKMDSEQSMTELNDRIAGFVTGKALLSQPLKVEINYTKEVPGKVSFFELAPLVKSLRAIILQSRPLEPGDISLYKEESSISGKAVIVHRERLTAIKGYLANLANFKSLDESVSYDNLKSLVTDGTDAAKVALYIDEFVALFSDAALCGLPQTCFGFALEWRRRLFKKILDKTDEHIQRWDDRLQRFDVLFASLASSSDDAQKIELLYKAERLVSTTVTTSSADVAELKGKVLDKQRAFVTKKENLYSAAHMSASSAAVILERLKLQLPLADFDSKEFDYSEEDGEVLLFVKDLKARVSVFMEDLTRRLSKVSELLPDSSAPATSAEKLAENFAEAARCIFGDEFRIVPEFRLSVEDGAELQNAWNNRGALLNHLMDDSGSETLISEFPVDEWLYGIARIREKMSHWENITMLTHAFDLQEPELQPLQLPFRENDAWLAMSFPETYVIDQDRLLYTAYYYNTFAKDVNQCGLLLDEWTEVIPAREETAGVAFHYDRPNSEAPQVMLLVTPPKSEGGWQWDDLVDTLNETLAMAKERLVEPEHLDNTPYSHFLPATLAATTAYPITIAMNFTRIELLLSQQGGGDG